MREQITAKILPNGNLKLTANNETRKYIKEQLLDNKGFWNIWMDLFEHYFTNGSYHPFDAGAGNPFVGLSDAPCIAECMNCDDNGNNEIEGRFWYYAEYMLRSELEELKNKGYVIYTLGA
jgi:hypothetical protein